ncbi:MAG: hypothetical protein HY332_05555 [Chloroflexi bacterium]|nr:hypothetical protein [Chloroflexota bacterium]
MEIRELVWDPTNRAKFRAHRIEQWEVDPMLVIDDWVVATHEDYPDQVRNIGPTRVRRMLTVAVEPTDDPAVWRPVTGWDSDREERAYHWEETRSSQ